MLWWSFYNNVCLLLNWTNESYANYNVRALKGSLTETDDQWSCVPGHAFFRQGCLLSWETDSSSFHVNKLRYQALSYFLAALLGLDRAELFLRPSREPPPNMAKAPAAAISKSCWVTQHHSKFVVCNPCQCCPFWTIPVPSWFILISLVYFYLSKLLF